jgi:hypothetical protein
MVQPGQLMISPNLTFFEKCFFSCLLGNQVFTNKNAGVNTGPYGAASILADGIVQKIDDTVRCTWTRNSVDIIQDIYPVAFEHSGQIVYKFKFFNHTNTPVVAQCQYLLDIDIGDPNDIDPIVKSNDGPIILTKWGYHNYWQIFPNYSTNQGIPPFFIGFLHNIPNAPSYNLGLSGMGYLDYGYPLYLSKPLNTIIGDWTKMIDWNFGIAPSWGPGTLIGSDCALLNIFSPITINGKTGVEAGRTSYGTGEYEICNGNIFGLLFYPHRIKWDRTRLIYNPNPFNIEFYAFDPNQHTAADNVSLTLTVGTNLTLVDTPGYNPLGKWQTLPTPPLPGVQINAGDIHVFDWYARADPAILCSGDIISSLKLTGISSFGPPTFVTDTCEHPITIECTEVDRDPPIFADHPDTNEFVKNTDVHDDRPTDRGLQSITWHPSGKKDSLNKSNFIITYSPAIKPCPTDKDTHVVHIVQLDSTIGACFDFTYEDCVGNESYETICLKAHPLIVYPDTLPPLFEELSVAGSFDSSLCNSRIDSFSVRDDRLHDKGIDTVTFGTGVNMSVSIAEPPKCSPLVRFSVHVLDSLQDGAICIHAIDCAGNRSDTCISYCTIADTLPPVVIITKDTTVRGRWTVVVVDNRPWDRYIDSIFIINPVNITFPPSGFPPLLSETFGQPIYSFVVTAIDTFQISSFCIRANDIAHNMSANVCAYQGIDSDRLCPNILVSPDPRLSPTSVSVSVNDIHFDDPPANLVTNIWDKGIRKVWCSDNSGINAPDTIYGNCAKTIPPFTLSVIDTLKIDTLSCVTINAEDCAGNICTYLWCYPYVFDSLPPILTAHHVGRDSIAVSVSDARTYDRGLGEMNTRAEINLSHYDTTALYTGLYSQEFGINRPNPDQSTLGELHAVDFWGKLSGLPGHEAFVSFSIWVQNLAMKQDILLEQGTSFRVPVYFALNDTFPVSVKGITSLSFGFTINGNTSGRVLTFDSVSTIATELAGWSITTAMTGDHIQVTGHKQAGGKALVADPTTTPPDSLLILCFTSFPGESLRTVTLEPDSVIYNDNHDTLFSGISATALMPPPLGRITGTTITIYGACTPAIRSGSTNPTAASLDPNHPNPFYRLTNFSYTVPLDGKVLLTIYDLLGNEIARLADGIQKHGSYTVTFDPANLSEGTYIARLETTGTVISRRIQLKK